MEGGQLVAGQVDGPIEEHVLSEVETGQTLGMAGGEEIETLHWRPHKVKLRMSTFLERSRDRLMPVSRRLFNCATRDCSI